MPGFGLLDHLRRAFQISDDVAKDLIAAADQMRRQTIDHFSLTDFIRRSATLEERIEVVRTMWRLVYADGFLSDQEEYLVKKLAHLLGLEHHVMIEAKLAVRQELGL